MSNSNNNITKPFSLLNNLTRGTPDGPTCQAVQEEDPLREEDLFPMTVTEEEHGGSFESETPVPAPAVSPPSMGLHDLPEELKTKLVDKSASVNGVQHTLKEHSTGHTEFTSNSKDNAMDMNAAHDHFNCDETCGLVAVK